MTKEANFPIKYSVDVAAALDKNQPLVALESTIITHGMPYPRNLETARLVESEVRHKGAVPATIAIIDGVIFIGLTDDQLTHLAQAQSVMKASRADLAYAVACRRTASTTVAATMILAHLAGLQVFATGGIGGVHRGAELSFDISADLKELSQTPVTVVSAGAKAILDIPATLEVLETLGVPVVGFQTDIFPAFWSRQSECPCPLTVQSVAEVASLMKMRNTLRLNGGLLIANPIPDEHEIPPATIERAIKKALEEAERDTINGKAVTPFLLQSVVNATDGAALEANIALVQNNAKLAADIAIELARPSHGL